VTLEEARKIIVAWLTSSEPIAAEWKLILPMCLNLIDEKLKMNDNEK
jgi:hypothetical protein